MVFGPSPKITKRYKDMLYMILFLFACCIFWAIWLRLGRLGKNSFTPKTDQNGILRGQKLHRFTQNQINLHWKPSQNHGIVINTNEAYFREKTPTHIGATYAITNFSQNFWSRIPRESGQKFYIMRFRIFTESEFLFGLGKIITGKKSAPRISA